MGKRTVKRGAIKSKAAKAAGASGIRTTRAQFKKLRKLTVEQAINEGVIESIKNPKGNHFYWFRKGRKLNWETRKKFDKDGYDKWGNFRMGATSYLKKKFG